MALDEEEEEEKEHLGSVETSAQRRTSLNTISFISSVHPDPIKKANFFSKLTFAWLNPLFQLGYKQPLVIISAFQLTRIQGRAGSLSDAKKL
jgi:hypothetical protein